MYCPIRALPTADSFWVRKLTSTTSWPSSPLGFLRLLTPHCGSTDLHLRTSVSSIRSPDTSSRARRSVQLCSTGSSIPWPKSWLWASNYGSCPICVTWLRPSPRLHWPSLAYACATRAGDLPGWTGPDRAQQKPHSSEVGFGVLPSWPSESKRVKSKTLIPTKVYIKVISL